MKNKSFITLLLLLAVLITSCKRKDDTEIIKNLSAGLYRSTENIKIQTDKIYYIIEERSANNINHDRLIIWQPKALVIKKISDDAVAYINSLQLELKQKAGLTWTYHIADKNAVDVIFNTNDKGNELYEKMKKYNTDILAVDTSIRNEFDTSMFYISKSDKTIEGSKQDFVNTYFSNTTPTAAMAALLYFENKIRDTENKTLRFCNAEIGEDNRDAICLGPQLLVNQNSSYIKAGGPIVITAGFGDYSKSSSAIIYINGKPSPIGICGATSYTIATPTKPGKYIIPIKGEYYNGYCKVVQTAKVIYEVTP
jgi:hypothetical protein